MTDIFGSGAQGGAENAKQPEETKCGMTYDQFVRKYLETDPNEFMAHIDAIWASLPSDS